MQEQAKMIVVPFVDGQTLQHWGPTVRGEIADVVTGLTDLLAGGEKLPLHPQSFEALSDPPLDPATEGKVRQVILLYAFRALGFNPKQPELLAEREDGRLFKTNQSHIVLGFDGTNWWLELSTFG